MKITINGQDADITLEHEKTVGDVLSGIMMWLNGSGGIVSGVVLDGIEAASADIPAAMSRLVDDVRSMDVRAQPRFSLVREALEAAKNALTACADAPFGERAALLEDFTAGAAASCLNEEMPDMAETALASLSGEGMSPLNAIKLIDERIREIETPLEELAGCASLVSETAVRLEDLPLDMQTGKDRRAMETVGIFSHVIEKLIRILTALKQTGFETDTIIVDSLPVEQFIHGFNSALQELLSAYEVKDTVLTGDIAEYELAPRLAALYSAIMDSVQRH
jgi:hypothetical protein